MVVAGMEVELRFLTRFTGMQVPAHFRSAATGDGPDGAALCLSHGAEFLTHIVRQEAAQHVDDGSSHGLVRWRWLAGQFQAEFFHQGAAVLLAAMGEVEIDHGGVDAAVA